MTREEKQKAIYALKKSVPFMAMTQEEFNDYIQTLNQVMDLLEQEPCEDAISRDAAIDLIADYELSMDEVVRGVHALPPVTPQPKIGHWIEEDVFDGDVAYRCSECGKLFWLESGTPKDYEYNFCPTCGAKMVEPQERSE